MIIMVIKYCTDVEDSIVCSDNDLGIDNVMMMMMIY